MDKAFLKEEISWLVCEHCGGDGEFELGECNVCRGLGVVGFLGDKVLYWGKRLEKKQIYFDKILASVRSIFNVCLLFVGLSGLAVLFYVASLQNFANLFDVRYWLMPSGDKVYFWFSVLILFYVSYRLSADLAGKKRVLPRKYSGANRVHLTWEDVFRREKSAFIDVSQSLDNDAENVFEKSYELAAGWGHLEISRLHLFAELFVFKEAAIVGARLGLNAEKLEEKIAHVLLHDYKTQMSGTVLSADLRKAAIASYVDVYHFGGDWIGIIDLLKAVVDKNLFGFNTERKDRIFEILLDFGVKSSDLNNVIQWVRILEKMRDQWSKFKSRARYKPKKGMDRAMTAVATPTLNSVSEDLTLAAREGLLFPCLGRDKEFAEMFRIMEGSRKPVLLVGNQGVGRTSIIHGLAQRMVEESVPEILRDKRLVSLSVPHLIAADPHASAEQKLMMVAQDLMRSGNVVLVIESLQSLATAGNAEGALGLGEILAQFLERGAFYAVATITPENYRAQIEGSALGEQFAVVNVNELEINDAIQVLEVKSSTIEYESKVFFSYRAIARAAELAVKYMQDTHLPENALAVLEQAANKVRRTRGEGAIVGQEDVAGILSEKTEIPLTAVTESESEKLLNLEEKIHRRVIGQSEAVKMVADSLRRARAELRDEKRPIASLLFVGPTGVGKTELAKAVAATYFGKEENMIRLDMSEFQEQSSVSRFLGAPRGFAGDKEGGYLTEAVRRKPFSLILVDEIEKAHPDILNLFLQIMEDGRLTDNMGRTVSFANTIIIMTSNAAADFVQSALLDGRTIENIRQTLINEKLKQYFRPEFINRLDGLIVFKPLDKVELVEVARLLVAKIAAKLSERGINLKVSDAALSEFAEHGYDPVFGARPLRRLMQEKIDNLLAKYLLGNKLDPRDKVVIDGIDNIKVEKREEI